MYPSMFDTNRVVGDDSSGNASCRNRNAEQENAFDTVCVMELGHFNNAIAIEQYVDENGRTILWRRFNRDDWAIKRYKKKWSEQLPNNEQLIINGETYVHWYDCITDYIF